MIELNIPGRGLITLEHLVSDVNGTLALDGQLLEGIARQLTSLRDRLQIHLITANTHNQQESIDLMLHLHAERIQPGGEMRQKADFIQRLGAEHVVAIGQGANDAAMLKAAAIGICVLSAEGAAVDALMSADIVVPNIYQALDLLEKPLRLVSTLRK